MSIVIDIGAHLAAACAALRGIEGAPRLTTELAKVFVFAALRPSLTMAELASALYMEQSVCSRRVAALASYRGKGHDLLTTAEDPQDRRRKTIELTEKGRRIADACLQVAERNSMSMSETSPQVPQ